MSLAPINSINHPLKAQNGVTLHPKTANHKRARSSSSLFQLLSVWFKTFSSLGFSFI